jgi:hypothetical protein
MKKVLFVASGYEVNNAMAGIGLRIWELAQVLTSEFAVTLLIPTPSDLSFPGITFVVRDNKTWPRVIEESDAVIFYDMPDTSMLLYAHRLGKQIICENAPPFEHLEYRAIRFSDDPKGKYAALIDAFKLQILLSDHFIIRSNVEHASILASLALCGRLNYTNYNISPTLSHLVSSIPVAFNESSDIKASAAIPSLDRVDFVWNGGVWDYYDPCQIVVAVDTLIRKNMPISVRFMYMPPSQQNIAEAKYLTNMIDTFGLRKYIKIHQDFIPHQERDGVILSSHAIICIGKHGIENATCHRFRLRDVFLYRLPIIIDSNGASGDFVRQLDIGLTVDGQNPEELAKAMYRLKVDGQLYGHFVSRIDAVRDLYTYEHNVDSLRQFLRTNLRAPDIGTARQEQAVSTLLLQRPELELPSWYPF